MSTETWWTAMVLARTEGLERRLHDIDRRMGSRLEVTDPALATRP